MKIQTLADIIAEQKQKDTNSDKSSAQNSRTNTNPNKTAYVNNTHNASYPQKIRKTDKVIKAVKSVKNTAVKKAKKQTPPTVNIKALLAEVKNEIADSESAQNIDTQSLDTHNLDIKNIDNLTTKIQDRLKTPEERQAEYDEIKANGRLRWLAFYYLSTREHSAKELKDKLLAKNQAPLKIDELLAEFAEKGYQSDMRTAFMLIREGIRKGRGRNRIKQDFYNKKVVIPTNINELIDMANEESDEFSEFVSDNPRNHSCSLKGKQSEQSDGKYSQSVDWLKLAVAARVKKYGSELPQEHKDRAKQLRFLQYRGFTTDICFDALSYDVESLEDDY